MIDVYRTMAPLPPCTHPHDQWEEFGPYEREEQCGRCGMIRLESGAWVPTPWPWQRSQWQRTCA